MADSDVTSDSRYQAYVEAVRSKNRVKLQEAIRKIREVYDSGTPFFTKDAIRDIMQQLEKVESGQLNEVSVMGLDGIVVQLPANIGEFKRDIEIPGVETVQYVACMFCPAFISLSIVSRLNAIIARKRVSDTAQLIISQ